MTDRYRVYTKVLKTLQTMVQLHYPGHGLVGTIVYGDLLVRAAQQTP
jgi:hypothetical protein